MTVKELKEACEFQIDIGNGDKHIAISRDDEGKWISSAVLLVLVRS